MTKKKKQEKLASMQRVKYMFLLQNNIDDYLKKRKAAGHTAIRV